jgi:DNA-directed DNA polymerase III PolC
VPAPEEIVAAAARERMPAVALTDAEGLYAAVPFYQAAREAGVKPIVGAELKIAWPAASDEGRDPQRAAAAHKATLKAASPECGGASAERSRGTPPDVDGEGGSRFPHSMELVLLAADAAGYSNLCRLVTLRHLNERPVSLAALNEHRAGLIAIVPQERNGENRHSKIENRDVRADDALSGARSPFSSADSFLLSSHLSSLVTGHSPLAALKELFGAALYLEVAWLSPGDRRAIRRTREAARALGVPVVATNDVHFLRPEEHLHHRVLNAIRTGGLVSTVAPPEITSAEAYFKSAAEMEKLFAEAPEALRATEEIAARANLELALGRTIFPEFAVPEGETPFSWLWKLAFDGARERYRPLRPEVLARLTHELEVIERLHLAPYFLLVREIATEARRRGIPAVARGSAASSMVTYCLGVSRVCPLRWGLYFERFLNEQRGDIPDIDLDICGARRDELLEWVYERWGQERVAMIASFVTMHARLAVREVAKAMGVAPGEVNHFTRRLPHRPVREIRAALATLPECRALPAGEEPWKTILAVAERLDGFPRHLGIHPCGTVIAARPLTELAPLEVATKGIVVTQYDMNAVEALGLVKMDLLGQRGLTTMSLALRNIEQTTGRAPDFDAIPEHDPATGAMIAAGRTLGVFQIESPGMRGLLRTMQARTLEELSLALALIRPGASEYGSKESFLRRVRGREPVRYPHPRLEPILADSRGVCVYQEQVMQIAQAIGSLTLAEADLIRRSSVKFADQRERQRLRAKFLKAAEKMGLDERRREETWRMVEKFAGFGFCKAHAATYADLAYRIAYLKAHYPAEFLAAMASADAGFYHVSAYVEEAKRLGIRVLLPSVNRSRFEYTVEAAAPAPEEASGRPAAPPAIRIGLRQVKGLGAATVEAILRARDERGPFASLEDFLARVSASREELEALIKCGAMDGLGATRPALLWQLNAARARDRARPRDAEGALLFAGAAPAPEPPPAVADYSRMERLAWEQRLLQVAVSGHPLDLLPRNGETWSDQLDRLRGRRATLLGWVITYRHVATKHHQNMMFITLEDQRGIFEAVLFPEAYRRYGGLVFETRMLRVTGRVENESQVNCERLEPARR